MNSTNVLNHKIKIKKIIKALVCHFDEFRPDDLINDHITLGVTVALQFSI
jgi:hypothetical protein